MRADYDTNVEWQAFELRPDNPPEGTPITPEDRVRYRGTVESLTQRAKSFGLEFRSPDKLPNSRRAFESAEFARTQGKHKEFHGAVFSKLYADNLDINSWDVLKSAADDAGLDAAEMQRQVESGAFSAIVGQQVDEGRALGINGVPTFIFNDRYAVVGAHPYDVFQQVMDKINSEADEA